DEDRLDASQRRRQRLRAGGVAAYHLRAAGQRGGSGMAGDRHHLRAAIQQQVHNLTSDVSRRSGNQDHSKLLSSVEGTLRWLNVNISHYLSVSRDIVVMTIT